MLLFNILTILITIVRSLRKSYKDCKTVILIRINSYTMLIDFKKN